MRKIILDLAVSLDGFIEGPNGETDWCILDADMNFDRFLDTIDAVFYGRKSYDAWGHYRPEGNAPDALFWEQVHAKTKYVFSHQSPEDTRAVWISSDLRNTIARIRAQAGKDIWLYGGAGLIQSFLELDLIDTYRISVHPIVLGSGKPLFENVQERIPLELVGTKAFRSGVVQLIYERSQQE